MLLLYLCFPISPSVILFMDHMPALQIVPERNVDSVGGQILGSILRVLNRIGTRTLYLYP